MERILELGVAFPSPRCVNILREQSLQMVFVHGDDVIQQVTTTPPVGSRTGAVLLRFGLAVAPGFLWVGIEPGRAGL
jgi:hypothetical protein